MCVKIFSVAHHVNAFYLTHLPTGQEACLGDGSERMEPDYDLLELELSDAALQDLLLDEEELPTFDDVANIWTDEANACAEMYLHAYFPDLSKGEDYVK